MTRSAQQDLAVGLQVEGITLRVDGAGQRRQGNAACSKSRIELTGDQIARNGEG